VMVGAFMDAEAEVIPLKGVMLDRDALTLDAAVARTQDGTEVPNGSQCPLEGGFSALRSRFVTRNCDDNGKSVGGLPGRGLWMTRWATSST
jgi:hypothetical protein